MQIDGPPKGKGKPKRTWMEPVKIYLKKCNLFKDLVKDRSEWRNIIHAVNPNVVRTRL